MVVMVTVVVVAAAPGVTCAGLKLHPIVESNPVQLNVIAFVKLPPAGVSVMVNVAMPPADTVAVDVPVDCVKSSPVPDMVVVLGLAVPSCATEMVAVLFPVAVGLKVTVIVQFAPAAMEPLHVFVCVNSEAFAPAKVIPLIAVTTGPELVSVRFFVVLLLVIGVPLNVSGPPARVPVPSAPVPVTADVVFVPAVPPLSLVTVNVPFTAPVAVGANFTATVQFPCAATDVGVAMLGVPQVPPAARVKVGEPVICTPVTTNATWLVLLIVTF
jgi:hypothetical protein